jgi:hypothetical protein
MVPTTNHGNMPCALGNAKDLGAASPEFQVPASPWANPKPSPELQTRSSKLAPPPWCYLLLPGAWCAKSAKQQIFTCHCHRSAASRRALLLLAAGASLALLCALQGV